MSKTIAAISTAQTVSGLGVIRISGDMAIEIADKVVQNANKKPLQTLKGYQAAFGKVIFDGEVVDECVSLVFRAPKSYTGEDVVEISCHGGLFVMKKVLRAVLEAGAVPAEAGEFTKRAFLNGKMDLSKAEAVMKLIHAHSEQGAKAAINALEGNLSRKIVELNEILISASASMGAWVDYPDDEIEELEVGTLLKNLEKVRDELSNLLKKFDCGQAIIDGVDTVIIGKPNVGKSALMNLLSGYSKSIVTDIAGTTRDIVEHTIRVGSVVLHLADTAGIRNTDDVVESIGVETAKSRLERATLILAVFDSSRELDDEDRAIIDYCRGKNVIAIVNKTDLDSDFGTNEISENFAQVVKISAKTGFGESQLAEKIDLVLGTADIDTTQAMLTTERQRVDTEQALGAIEQAIDACKMGVTMDAINVCIDDAVGCLLSLTGEKATEKTIENIFSRFCVGK